MMISRFCLAVVTASMFGLSLSVASQETPQEQFVGELIDKAIKVLELPIEAKAEREAGFYALLNQNFVQNKVLLFPLLQLFLFHFYLILNG